MSNNFYAEFLKTIETNNREIQDARIELKLSQAYKAHGRDSFFYGWLVGLLSTAALAIVGIWIGGGFQ